MWVTYSEMRVAIRWFCHLVNDLPLVSCISSYNPLDSLCLPSSCLLGVESEINNTIKPPQARSFSPSHSLLLVDINHHWQLVFIQTVPISPIWWAYGTKKIHWILVVQKNFQIQMKLNNHNADIYLKICNSILVLQRCDYSKMTTTVSKITNRQLRCCLDGILLYYIFVFFTQCYAHSFSK